MSGTNDLFLRACRGEAVERTPVWMMRQAGRYLPEYRAVRAKHDFVTLCKSPDLATEVTLQPIRRFGFDASILFSDILVPAEPMGFKVAFNPGPEIDHPVRSSADVDRVRVPDPEQELPYVYETLRNLRRELDGKAALIGFAAAPFTLACYLIEGAGSKSFSHVKAMLFGAPADAHRLLDKVARMTTAYLAAQIDAGAQAIQLFDSWAGLLAPGPFREFSLRYARQVLDGLAGRGVPRIYFALNGAHLMQEIGECGADVIGVDWRTPLDRASAQLGQRFPLQGNLDPGALFAPRPAIAAQVQEILGLAADLPGHIFNLGHGVLPSTPIEAVEQLVCSVRGE